MESPVNSSKTKYESPSPKDLHKVGDVKNRGWPKGKKRYPKSPGAPKQPLSGYVHFLNESLKGREPFGGDVADAVLGRGAKRSVTSAPGSRYV